MKKTDYIFIEKSHVHEGLASGTISKVAFVMTKDYIFKILLESIGAMGTTTTQTNYLNTEALLNELSEKLGKQEMSLIEEYLISELPSDWVFKVNQLEHFSVKVGFWMVGSVTLKPNGSKNIQTLDVQPKAKRQEIKDFYNL